jgi:hypothetical protein
MRLATIFCALGAVSAAVLKEPRTGIGFQEKRGGGTLGKLGVRTKGPIKVYAVGEYDNGDYVLKMSYGVSAAKMVSALGDALKPRCGDAKMVEKFEECLLAGLPDGSPACRTTRIRCPWATRALTAAAATWQARPRAHKWPSRPVAVA